MSKRSNTVLAQDDAPHFLFSALPIDVAPLILAQLDARDLQQLITYMMRHEFGIEPPRYTHKNGELASVEVPDESHAQWLRLFDAHLHQRWPGLYLELVRGRHDHIVMRQHRANNGANNWVVEYNWYKWAVTAPFLELFKFLDVDFARTDPEYPFATHYLSGLAIQ